MMSPICRAKAGIFTEKRRCRVSFFTVPDLSNAPFSPFTIIISLFATPLCLTLDVSLIAIAIYAIAGNGGGQHQPGDSFLCPEEVDVAALPHFLYFRIFLSSPPFKIIRSIPSIPLRDEQHRAIIPGIKGREIRLSNHRSCQLCDA